MTYKPRLELANSSPSYDEVPTRLEMAISLLTRQGTSEGRGAVHPRSIRIPMIENVTIEALSQYSGVSVNKVICQLIEVGLDEVFQGMNDEHRSAVIAVRSKLLGDLYDENGELKDQLQAKEGEI